MRIFKLMLVAALSLTCLQVEAKEKKEKKEKKVKTTKTTKTKKVIQKAALTNTTWRLSEMNGKPVPAGNNDAYIYLNGKTGTVVGSTSCNNISGDYKDGRHDELSFTIATTEMFCESQQHMETYFLNALKGTTRYKQNGNNLLLYNGNILLAVLEARW